MTPAVSPRVMVAEDELLVAMDTESMVQACGCAVLGPVASVQAALALLERDRPDAAILDINLAEQRIWPVVAALRELGVPFVLVTGYDSSEVPEAFRGSPVLSKPTSQHALSRALAEIGVSNSSLTPQ